MKLSEQYTSQTKFLRLLLLYLFVALWLPLFSAEGVGAQDVADHRGSPIDSLMVNYKQAFRSNINQLDKYPGLSSGELMPGDISSHPVDDVKGQFDKIDLQLFNDFEEETTDFYRFLEDLDLSQQHNLIRLFYYQKEQIDPLVKAAGLPLEIACIPAALTAMNQEGQGENQRAGMWQLTHFQGVFNGLEINRLVDERYNPKLSAEAAIQEINKKTKRYATPELAVLAYWFGDTRLANVLARLPDEPELEQVIQFLPEAKVRIAAFQAVALYFTAHRLRKPVDYVEVKRPDTVNVHQSLHFEQIEQVLDLPASAIRYLNPQYRFSIVPEDKHVYRLVLPAGYWDDYVLWSDSIQNCRDSALFEVVSQTIEYPPAPGRQYAGEPVKDLEIEGKTKIAYRLRTGDVLGIVAEKFDVRVTDLKYWNNISNERRIQAGRNIDIFVDDDKADYYRELVEQSTSRAVAKKEASGKALNANIDVLANQQNVVKVEHTVKNGESPYVIAKKYKGVTPDDILEWNGIDDARKIQVGQKLILYLKHEAF